MRPLSVSCTFKCFSERLVVALVVLWRDAVKDLMTLTETDIANIYKVFIAIWSQIISAMMNELVFSRETTQCP